MRKQNNDSLEQKKQESMNRNLAKRNGQQASENGDKKRTGPNRPSI